MRRSLIAGFLLLCALAAPACAARLVVTIDGLHSAKGHVLVALFSKSEGFPDGDYSIAHTKIKARLGTSTVIFDNLPPGNYAVGCYHDEDDNNRLDTNWIGYPTEGYALSNGIRAIIARPRFIDAAFVVGGDETHVPLHVRY